MKICLDPLVRFLSGRTDETMTKEDQGLSRVLGARIAFLEAAGLL
jgi:hypothetical protein